MTTTVNSLDILKGLVEKVLFDQDNLNLLKIKITQLSQNEISQKKMKQLILNQRAIMLDEILELFPFFIKKIQEDGNSRTNLSDINNSELEKKLREREELLVLVARRIEGLVQGNQVMEKNDVNNVDDDTFSFSIEEIVIKELQVIDIDSWLKMFNYLDLENTMVRDDFRLLVRLFGNIGIYHERMFEKDDELPMPKKIKELKFPIELEKDLILLNKTRNDAVHNGKEIHGDDQLLIYNVFFRVLEFLLEYHVKEKVNTLCSNNMDKRIVYKEASNVLANFIAKKVSKTSWEHPQLRNLIIKVFS